MAVSTARFSEQSSELAQEERERLLSSRIDELNLRIEGSRLEPLVQRLYEELDGAGISLRPEVYLAEEWGCPDGLPVIGIPFYLADEQLLALEREHMDGVEAESDEEVLSYLRHEAGHAFGYAYRLHETEEWHRIFGPYSRPYREDYEPNPFSRNFVRHLAGWYAQKHPDEDFAETFAVWLDPLSNWRAAYEGWGCYHKLLYVDRMVQALGRTPPAVVPEPYDPGDELLHSLREHHSRFRYQAREVPAHFDGDLRELFEQRPDRGLGEPVGFEHGADVLLRNRRSIVGKVSYWTGLHDHIVRSLVEHLAERCRALDLWVEKRREQELLLQLVAYVTTLCMNRLYKGDFVIK
jgi:hypothetical protein